MIVVVDICFIFVPTDFSTGSRAAIDWALTLAGGFGATVHLLHVGQVVAEGPTPPSGALLDVYHRAREEAGRVARAHLDQLQGELAQAHPDVTLTTLVRSGPAHEAICAAARELDVSMIVMGSQGLSGLSRFMIGSTAERVVRASDVPVLTVRSQA